MKLNVVNSAELIVLAIQDELLKKLMQQVEKDFVLANSPIQFVTNTKPDELVSVIREKVYFLIMEHFEEYLNLMYVIDIPEKEFQNIEITDSVEVADQVAFLILKREYKKVWYRHKYQ